MTKHTYMQGINPAEQMRARNPVTNELVMIPRYILLHPSVGAKPGTLVDMKGFRHVEPFVPPTIGNGIWSGRRAISPVVVHSRSSD